MTIDDFGLFVFIPACIVIIVLLVAMVEFLF